MRDLNIELAEIVMGLTLHEDWCGDVWKDAKGKEVLGEYHNSYGDSFPNDWEPLENPSQLKMCWQALSWEQKATYKQLVIDHDVQSVFESPEQHAELILKAKQ
jgi:hypothetical protein